MASPEIIPTADGSHSLFHAQLNETYHSRHGAIRESQHVYIDYGLAPLVGLRRINILEVGFGTGLNCLLAWKWVRANGIIARYITLEPYPLQSQTWRGLNYPDLLGMQTEYTQLHEAPFDVELHLDKNFSVQKRFSLVQQTQLEPEHYDIIFFDAFGPEKQPDMWTQDVFKKLYSASRIGAQLVTYCAKGQVRRDLRSVGFRVESLPGPPGKREMTRATRQLPQGAVMQP